MKSTKMDVNYIKVLEDNVQRHKVEMNELRVKITMIATERDTLHEVIKTMCSYAYGTEPKPLHQNNKRSP